jgi:UDPglucose 6-dehydrogenase
VARCEKEDLNRSIRTNLRELEVMSIFDGREMKVGIIGMGFIGKAMRDMLENRAEVVSYDPVTDSVYPDAELATCDFGIICVGTPTGPDGVCDVSEVESAIRKIPIRRILMKSTVALGTTDRLVEITGKEICFSPEFLCEQKYISVEPMDSLSTIGFTVLGGEKQIRHYFCGALAPILGPSETYFQCQAMEAELIKYMINSFLALKVSFVNECYDICDALDLDWYQVREGWLLDSRIGRSHSAVFPSARGFGGKCLPKDVAGFIASLDANGIEASLLRAVARANEVRNLA